MAGSTLRIATRGSELALAQARWVQSEIMRLHPTCKVELVIITSHGDVAQDKPLHELGGVGLFTKEIQQALLSKQAEIAVHSLKDLPTVVPSDLILAAVPERAPVEDCLISPQWQTLAQLPANARIGTSSLRRIAQLKLHRPDLQIENMRGNVDTRLRKLHDQNLDGILLAHAGLTRLGRAQEITQVIDVDVMVPAVGQGALGIECRRDDHTTIELLASLNHLPTQQAVLAERAFLRRLEGGCQVPIGAFAWVEEASEDDEGEDGIKQTEGHQNSERSDFASNELSMVGVVLDRDGTKAIRHELIGPAHMGEKVGTALAELLIARGAADLLGIS